MRAPLGLLVVVLAAAGCNAGTQHVPSAAPSPTPRGGALVGIVTDETGAPLSFVTVSAWSDDRERGLYTTASDGRYRLEELPPGSYELVAYYTGRRVRAHGVEVRLGRETAHDLTIPAPPTPPALLAPAGEEADSARFGAIDGRIRDKLTGEGMPGAVVSATSSALTDTAMVMADGEGRFRFTDLPPGTYVLSVYYHLISRGNIEFRRSGVRVEAGIVTPADLEIDVKVDD